MSARSSVHPLAGVVRYSGWLLQLAWLRQTGGRKPRDGTRHPTPSSFVVFAQGVFTLGIVLGVAYAIAFTTVAYTSVHGHTALAAGGRPTRSSFTPCVWAAVCLLGTSLGGGLMQWASLQGRCQPTCSSVTRFTYFLYVLGMALASVVGAVLYPNVSAWMLVACLLWLLAAAIAVQIACALLLQENTASGTYDELSTTNTPMSRRERERRGSSKPSELGSHKRRSSDDPSIPEPEAPPARSWWGFVADVFVWTLSWLLVLLFCIICGMFATQQVLSASGSGAALGRMHTIVTSGHAVSVQTECQGFRTKANNFTIMLEHDILSSYISLKPMADVLAQKYHVCGFSRPGYAWSQAGVYPRILQQLTSESRAIQAKIGLQPPFMLIGHGVGGQLAQRYARMWPQDVIAVVGIDTAPTIHWYVTATTDPQDTLEFQLETATTFYAHRLHVLDAFRFLASPLGFLSVAARMPNKTPGFPDNLRASQHWAMGLDSAWNAAYSEVLGLVGPPEDVETAFEDEELALEPGMLGDTPLLLLPAGRQRLDGVFEYCSDDQLGGQSCVDYDLKHGMFEALQDAQANTSRDGSVVRCPATCSHAMPVEQTTFVTDAIDAFVESFVEASLEAVEESGAKPRSAWPTQ